VARFRPRIALYPVLLAIALVVELLNGSGSSLFAAVRSLAIVAVVAIALSWLGRLILRDADRGGILAALWVLALLAGEDLRVAAVIAVASGLLIGERYLLPARYETIRWGRIGRVFGRLAIILALAIAIQAVQLGALSAALRSLTHETALRPATPDPVDPSDPDIYMVLVDGHARPDVVSDVFGRDQTEFVGALRDSGFVVAPRSRANYSQTAEVLSSMFNQAHLADIDRLDRLLAGTESRPYGAMARHVINDNVTFTYLRSRGYEIHAVSSGYEQMAIREADYFHDGGEINEFEVSVLYRSALSHVLERLAPDFVSSQQRHRIQGAFDAFAESPSWPGERPRFVFAHVPSPHAPWVFNADGSPRTVGDIQTFYAETPASLGRPNEELAEAYGAQVVDSDRRLLESLGRLDEAIAQRGRPAVVVVFSDHGSWVYADGGDIRLRFKNLLAIRATDRTLELEPNMTLVNFLPSLFEQLYGTDWVRRPDSLYTYRFGQRDPFEPVPVDDPDATISP
jgi:hypothetical protein